MATRRDRTIRRGVALLASGALVLGACSSDDDASTSATAPPEATDDVVAGAASGSAVELSDASRGAVSAFDLATGASESVVYCQSPDGTTQSAFSSAVTIPGADPVGAGGASQLTLWRSPDGATVLTEADAEYHLIDVATGADQDLGPVGLSSIVGFAADSSRLAYVTDDGSTTTLSAIALGVEGAAPVELTTSQVQLEVPVTSDGSHVVFAAGSGSAGDLATLGYVATEGGPVTTLATAPEGQQIAYLELSDDDRTVLYVTAEGQSGAWAWTVPVDGGDAVQLGEAQWATFAPDDTTVVLTTFTGGRNLLFSAPADGSSQPTRIGGTDQDVENDDAILFSADGSTVVYFAAVGDDGAVFAAPLDGSSAPTPLNGDVDVDAANPVLVAGDHVVFSGGAQAAEAGPPATAAARAGDAPVVGTPCAAMPVPPQAFTLYASPLAGGTPVALTGDQPKTADYVASPDGSLVGFTGDDGSGQAGAFVVATASPDAVTRVGGPGTDPASPRFTEDGQHLVFVLDPGTGSAALLSAAVPSP